MQFPEYTEVCEECGQDVDAGQLRAHPLADPDMEHPQYVCKPCAEAAKESANEDADTPEEGEVAWQEEWDQDLSQRSR